MTYVGLARLRLKIAFDEQERETFGMIDAGRNRLLAEGTTSITRHADAAVDVLFDRLEDAAREVVAGLRKESMQSAQADFSALWEAVGSVVPEEIDKSIAKFREHMSKTWERSEQREQVIRHVDGRVEGRREFLVADIQNRVHECVVSRSLLMPANRRSAEEVVALLEGVTAVVKSHGDVMGFLVKHSAQFERIETEVKRQGLDVVFMADRLSESMMKELTTRAGFNSLVSGAATNATWDGIKVLFDSMRGLIER